MPELPEVEITARLLDVELRGARIESVLAPGINALKTFDPPLSELTGREVQSVRRAGKHLIVDLRGGLSLLVHLMSAGRLQLYEQRAGPRDRTSRLLVRLAWPVSGQDPADGAAATGEAAPTRGGDGRAREAASSREKGTGKQGPVREAELRLREFGTKQAAWVKLLATDALQADEALAKLGPEAWPETPDLKELLSVPRPLNALLRDQRVIAGIGRSWADEILWEARLSPFKRGGDLEDDELERLRLAIRDTLGGAIEHYARSLTLPMPDKLPMPLKVHRREGKACPRCGTGLLAVHFEDHVIAYCPACQTEGRVLKDRRLSRLLK